MAATPLIPTHLRATYRPRRFALKQPVIQRALVAGALLSAALVGYWIHYFQSAQEARKEAIEFVQLHQGGGHISHGYRNSFCPKLSMTTTAYVAEDRMNDRMATQLLSIYDLNGVIVYKPVPNAGRLDTPPNHWNVPSSLRKLDLPMSEKSIAALERRFPRLKVYILKPVGVKE